MSIRLISLTLFSALVNVFSLNALQIDGTNYQISKDEVYIESANQDAVVETDDSAKSLKKLRALVKEQNTAAQTVSMVLYPEGTVRNSASRRVLSSEILVRLTEDANLDLLAKGIQADYLGPSSFDAAWHRIKVGDPSTVDQARDQLMRQTDVLAARLQIGRMHVRYAPPNDSYFADQWHLAPSAGSTFGVNVHSVWDNYRGDGIHIGIIDDGLSVSHPDLTANVDTAIDYDFRDDDTDPSPAKGLVDTDDGRHSSTEDPHGTAVAGVAAARGFNTIGGTGVAPYSKIVGLRLIGGYTTDAQEAAAFSHHADTIQIKNNSWGPADHGDILSAPGPLAHQSIEDATQTGRNGLGTIFVFAAGNGLLEEDDSNKSGYTALPEVIAVSAVGADGRQAYYSEPGANILTCAPASSLHQPGLIAPDLLGNDGYNHSSAFGELVDTAYTQTFGGTSGAAPIVSGGIALMLEANPNLNWRDVQEILIQTAQKNDASDAGWFTNASPEGYSFNRKYGAGMIDIAAAVTAAKTWTNLGVERRAARQTTTSLPRTIPRLSGTGITQNFPFSGTQLRVEHIQATLSIEHETRGDLLIRITSPSNTSTDLLVPHLDAESDIYDWSFMSTHFWGESASGTWTIQLIDETNGAQAGRLLQATLTLRGSETAAPVIPETPSRLRANRQWSNQAHLSWEDRSDNETGFIIERSTAFNAPWSVVATTAPNITSYYDYTVDPYTHYFYRIKAINNAHVSGYSQTVDSYKTFGLEVDLYATGFEASEGYSNQQSINQQQVWTTAGNQNAAQVINDNFGSIQGNYLRLGNTTVSGEGYHTASALVPYYPSENDVVTITSKVAFRSNGFAFDDFDFAFYNLEGRLLFVVAFDLYDQGVFGYDGDGSVINSSARFSLDRVYDLTVTVDTAADTWSARLDNTTLFANRALISDASLARNLGYIDADWYRYAASQNTNYMMVDDLTITVSASEAPTQPEQVNLIEVAHDAIYITWLNSTYASQYELDYRVIGSSSWTAFDLSDFDSFDYPFVILDQLEADTAYQVRIRARNQHGASAYSYGDARTYTLTEDWLYRFDLPTELDLSSDYDGDGIVLMLEYALGLNPDSHFLSTVGLPTFSINETADHVTLTYYKARDDINYTVLQSPDLSPGSWTATGVIQQHVVNGREITAAFPKAGALSAFLRLSVEE